MRTLTRTDAIYALVGGQISGVEGGETRYHDGQTPPTEEAIQATLTELQAEYDSLEYARNRANEYPSTGDQLDYIFHNGVAKWKTDIIQPVKDKFPKP